MSMTRVAKSLLTNKDKQRATLDPKQRSKITEDIRKKLYNEIIGQDNAIDTIVDSMSRLITGIRNLEKPILNLLFLGPTGTGKTETVKVLADSFFGSRVAFTRINCQELSAEHTVAKLLGSPPGYIGGDVQPLLSEENIIRHCEEAWVKEKGVYTETNEISRKYDPSQNEFLSIILFDEIEKAHSKVWTTLLGLMDDGHLVLSNNDKVDFTNTIIIMTTNVGSREMDEELSGNSIGFDMNKGEIDISSLRRRAKEAIESHFPPEFVQRNRRHLPPSGVRRACRPGRQGPDSAHPARQVAGALRGSDW